MGRKKAVASKSSCSSSPDCSAASPDLLCEEDVQCPICLNILVEPVRMPCSHCLCLTCFTINLKKSTLQCPVCRARIGTFARRSMKADTLVDEVLWKAIQKQFKQKLKLQKMETADRNALLPINRVASPVVGSPAAPGEIRKEFEAQMRQLQQAHQHEAQLAADEELAARLQAAINTPAGVTRRHSLAATGSAESGNTSTDSESDESEEEEASESKRSARRLFVNLTNKSIAKDKSVSRKRKAAPGTGSAAKENSVPGSRVKGGSKKRRHQFAGCVKRPRLAGTAVLNITLDSTDDETEVSFKSDNASLNTSTSMTLASSKEVSSNTSVIGKVNNKATKVSRPISTAAKSGNKQSPPNQSADVKHTVLNKKRTSHVFKVSKRASGEASLASTSTSSYSSETSTAADSSRASLSSGGSSGRTSSGYASGSSSVTPQQRGRKQLGLDELQDVALALLREGPHDLTSTAALVAEQRALEQALKQEAEDLKLAQQLQRQFTKLKVDRTQGSGEEYGLRSRDPSVGVGRRRAREASAGRTRVTVIRDASPCY